MSNKEEILKTFQDESEFKVARLENRPKNAGWYESAEKIVRSFRVVIIEYSENHPESPFKKKYIDFCERLAKVRSLNTSNI